MAGPEIPVELGAVDPVVEVARLSDESLLVEGTGLRLQLVRGRIGWISARADDVDEGRSVRVQILPEGIQADREVVGDVPEERRAQARTVAVIDMVLAEVRIVDVPGTWP